MDDTVLEEQPPRRGHALTPRRIAAVVGLAMLAVTLRRRVRFVRDVFKHRRKLKLAFAVLMLLRRLRKA